MTINKNTYYITPKYLLHGAITISRATSSKYHLNKRDKSNGFYLTKELNGISFIIPFSALFETNNKIAPIRSLSFIKATSCPSAKRGYCQLNNSNQTCYAVNGQLRANGSYIGKNSRNYGLQKLNSTMTSDLISNCLDIIQKSDKLTNSLGAYIREFIPIVRFNLKGDFRNCQDIEFLAKLSRLAPKTKFYGYTARNDLKQELNKLILNNNIYLNGSNDKYTNRFKATYDLKEWLLTNKICLGGCLGCKKCYTLKDNTILCLVHGKNQDIDLNTWLNRVFLCGLFNSLNSQDSPILEPKDLTVKNGLLESLNYQIRAKLNINDLSFNDFWDLREWLNGLTYEIWDNKELIRNYDYLKALGVA